MLSLDTWHMLSHGTSTHLTWYCDTWLDTITPVTCITWHIHDYHFYGDLAWLLYCYQTSGTSELLYSWTLVSPVLMSPALLLLLIAQSYRRPAEHAWCRDDEDVSHDRASVQRILNGTKCHTEQSATPHTWWGPPLESVGVTSRIHSLHRAKCHTEQSTTPHTWWGPPLESVGAPLESVGLPPESTLRAKCHMEQSVTPHTWWGPPLESVGLLPPSCLCRLVLAW